VVRVARPVRRAPARSSPPAPAPRRPPRSAPAPAAAADLSGGACGPRRPGDG
jgi:hypothetical protein